MKRTPQPQPCRRLEFKCKLYDLIKELDKLLDSEYEHSRRVDARRGMRTPSSKYPTREYMKKEKECCCPPGCCKESMKLKLPKLPTPVKSKPHIDVQAADNISGSHHPWHDEDHGQGCRPVHDTMVHRPDLYRGMERQPPELSTQAFPFPQTIEEMHQMGCFVSKLA